MEQTQSLPPRSKISYALGAVGKDMVYMLSASYVLYYFQDVLGVSAVAMGIILLAFVVFAPLISLGFALYARKSVKVYNRTSF